MKRNDLLGRALKSLAQIGRHPLKSFKSLSSNGKLAVFLTLLLVLTGIFSLIYVLNTTNEDPQEVVSNDFETQISTLTALEATITKVEGNVYHKTATGEWERATLETIVNTEDEVKTEGAASRVIVAFENGSEMRLDGDTHARINASAKEKIESFILNGKTYNRVVEGTTTPYSVKSTDAHYEAIGTAFIAESSGDRQSVEVIESSIIETTTNNTISEGNRYIVKSVVDPTENKKIEKLDINTYKNDPFIEWNLAIDTSREEYKNKLGFLQDTEAPVISITSPKQDEVLLTESSSETGSVTIKGKASGAISVKIIAKSISGSPVTDVDVANDGTFTAPPIDSPLGLSVFEIEARDRAGNIANESLRVTIQQKSAPAEEGSLLLLKSVTVKDDKLSLSWYASASIDTSLVRVVYSKNDNLTLANNDGVWTPTKKGEPPVTITENFDSGGLDKTTYYFKVCELNEAQNSCKTLSNSLSATIE